MAAKGVGENRSNNVEEGTTSILDDNKSRSSSVSSASVESASSAELSSQDPDDRDQNERDSFARDHKQHEKVLPKLETPPSSTLESPPSASSMLEFPPVQTMERPPMSPDSSEFRIPSSNVFAANNPSTPNRQWSIGSNESLFSIHNMSFTRGDFNMLLKSGDLSMYGDILKSGELGNMCKSGELPSPLIDALKSLRGQMPTTPRNDMHKSGEQIKGVDIGVKEDNSVSEVTNVKRENPSMDELPCPASVSRETEAYAPSFASQVVGKSERRSSVSSRPGKSERSSSVSLKPGKSGRSSSASCDEEKLKEQSNKADEATSSPSSSPSWLFCFGCCGKTI